MRQTSNFIRKFRLNIILPSMPKTEIECPFVAALPAELSPNFPASVGCLCDKLAVLRAVTKGTPSIVFFSPAFM
jgi:hypothetical protein